MTEPVNTLLHLDWEEYGMTSDPYITLVMQGCGVVLMLIGASCLFTQRKHTRLNDLLLVATGIMMLFAFASWLEKGWQIGMLIELALQVFAPLFLWLHLRRPLPHRPSLLFIQMAASLTFIGHGLYAIGHHPVPADFVTMCMKVLGMNEATSLQTLRVAGWLDFLTAIGIFIPWYRVRSACLVYMIGWGFLTSLARIVSHYHPAEKYNGIDPWLAETLARTPHWLIPLALYLLLRRSPAAEPISLQDSGSGQ